MTAQLRDHLIHLGQDREGPRGAYELHLEGWAYIFWGWGEERRDLLQQVEQVYRMEADGGSLPGL